MFLTCSISPPANIVSKPSLFGIDANSFNLDASTTVPSTIPTSNVNVLCSFAKSAKALIGAIASLPNAKALGPSRV